jgi:selenide, water dikinase
MTTAANLTSFSASAGCGCKVPALALLPLLRALAQPPDSRVLVGYGTGDDAAVVRVRDFFTPVVDDPYDFGRVAATNALSDVYAMGADPLSALNLVAVPLRQLGVDAVSEILRGGKEVVREAGAIVVGGHSIDDPEPKYGLAVTGTIDPRAVITNAGGQPGDALVLTKPLGAGAIVAARKRDTAGDALVAAAVDTMTTLNRSASAAARAAGAHAMTDVTGFGLLGHLHGLALASGVAAELDTCAVPALAGVRALLDDGAGISGGTRRNAEYAQGFTRVSEGVPAWRHWLSCDATTSGGLLVALPPGQAGGVPGAVIGHLIEGSPGHIDMH